MKQLRSSLSAAVVITCVILLAAPARAQLGSSGIAGVVKDATGAVLPRVTVEASSPALIERVRSVVTDGEGQYKLVNLVPGEYAVFTTRAGPRGEVLQEEWNRIWRCPVDEMGGRRSFITDYEVYDRRSADPMRSQVEIHIGLQ